jgi:hypothetical protein
LPFLPGHDLIDQAAWTAHPSGQAGFHVLRDSGALLRMTSGSPVRPRRRPHLLASAATRIPFIARLPAARHQGSASATGAHPLTGKRHADLPSRMGGACMPLELRTIEYHLSTG